MADFRNYKHCKHFSYPWAIGKNKLWFLSSLAQLGGLSLFKMSQAEKVHQDVPTGSLLKDGCIENEHPNNTHGSTLQTLKQDMQ